MPAIKADKEVWKAFGYLLLLGAVVELVTTAVIVGVFLWIL